MKFLFSVIIVFSTLCYSLPPYKVNYSDSHESWIRRTRSATTREAFDNKRVITVFGYSLKIPKFIHSMSKSVKDFFVGPSGIVGKIKEFLKGNSKLSTHVFGRKVDFQAHVPLSKEDVGKSFNSFLKKFRKDPMTRVLFVMYLNVVVVIVVFMVLLAKHVQISLQTMRDSRSKKNIVGAPATHMRTISPDISMPIEYPRYHQSPETEETLQEDRTQSSPSKSIDWSAMANPSLLNVVNHETIVITHKSPRLLNDIEGLLSSSIENNESPSVSRKRSDMSISSGEGPSTLTPKSSISSNSAGGVTRMSSFFTAIEPPKSSSSTSRTQSPSTVDNNMDKT